MGLECFTGCAAAEYSVCVTSERDKRLEAAWGQVLTFLDSYCMHSTPQCGVCHYYHAALSCFAKIDF